MMTRLALIPLLAATVSGFSPVPGWVLTPHGLGPVRIGMTVERVQQILGTKLVANGDPNDDPAVCAEMGADTLHGVSMLFETGRLTSIELYDAARFSTAPGIALGDTEAKVRAKFPNSLKVTSRAYYDPPSHARELTARDRSGLAFVFLTTETGIVDQIRAGGRSVGYMEGCE